VQLLKGKLDAGLLAQDSLQSQVELLQFENAAHEANVAGLRRLFSTKQGNLHDEAQSLSRDGNAPISFRESALLAHLEGRAKESEQRAESMMFQKNEAQSRSCPSTARSPSLPLLFSTHFLLPFSDAS
jgi:hypothetical protein